MIAINDKSRCSGCTACYAACPRHAIEMVPDELGFKYPQINMELCIDCGLCVKVCSFCTPQLSDKPRGVFAARNVDLNEVKSSQSGALFPAFYKTIIKEKGVVFGASFNESLLVEHTAADVEEACAVFKGSKYVQSDMGDSYHSVIKHLKEGKIVLFSGTPCQVSGLLRVVPTSLKRDLFTVDIICHGVPSPHLYIDYLTYIGETRHSKVKEFNFRDKSLNGWHDKKEKAVLENGDSIVDTTFANLFYTNCFLRESCYSCPFASTRRASDITLGDLWGWEKIDASLNEDDLGVSLVLINTQKGARLLESSKPYVHLKQVNLEQCMQSNLMVPTQKPSYRQELISVYVRDGIQSLIHYAFSPSFLQRVLRKIKRFWHHEQ
ncbi:MAG: Coenzyme F420 hydrogenase/dehydrogenase, beta subunit C-terminal domain [Bacteroidota bacterium]|nr:Coenzyme F420 hydrogenase/dehydrogenase, beta subunit C-terminal domain [Bacteroidota bacterium]